jgi:hypothetical protein
VRFLDALGTYLKDLHLKQRPLPDKTQESQQTYIHAPGGIRNQNLIRRAAADLLLRPHGHWDRQMQDYDTEIDNGDKSLQ